jgi:hypothetical protein
MKNILFAVLGTIVTVAFMLCAGCPTIPPVTPNDASDGATADVVTPWNLPEAGPDASPVLVSEGGAIVDPGFVIEPTCAAAGVVLRNNHCVEGDDLDKFNVVCTLSRSGTFDFREACVARAQSADAIRQCCGANEVCSHMKCRPSKLGARK